jgi:CRISPR-associated protein Csb2
MGPHPVFNAALYTLDVLIPAPALGQASDFDPQGATLALAAGLHILGWTGRASAYVVENATSARGGSQVWPGRTNGMRTRAFAVPTTGSFAVVWPQADPPSSVLARLSGLARTVPYVGRSTSLAEVSASGSAPARAGSWVIYESASLGDPEAACELRVPYPRYTDELQAAYRDGRRSWEVARTLPYMGGDGPARRPAVAGPRPRAGRLRS